MNVIETCTHGIKWGHYCPRCWRWLRDIENEAHRLRAEREAAANRRSE
jgi:hypothetical protein